jgi:hypothetical protein
VGGGHDPPNDIGTVHRPERGGVIAGGAAETEKVVLEVAENAIE